MRDHGVSMDKEDWDIVEMYAYMVPVKYTKSGSKLKTEAIVRLYYSHKQKQWSLKSINIPGFVDIKND